MKLFWIKNKILIVTLAAVLALGVGFWGALRLFEAGKMQETLIRTAEAEAEETPTPAPQRSDAGDPAESAPTPTTDPQTEKAEEARWETMMREMRFSAVIPRISNTMPYDSKSWKEGEAVTEELAQKAKQTVQSDFSAIMGRAYDSADMTVTRYTDEKGYRENILRLTDEKSTFVAVLLEKDLSIVAMETIEYDPAKQVNVMQDAAVVANLLGTKVDESRSHKQLGGNGGQRPQTSFAVALADGRWVSLAYTQNGLHGVKVHPDEYAMWESVCFQADIRHNENVVKPVAAANFEQGDLEHIAEGDMTPEQVALMYRVFLSAANGRASERRQLDGKTMAEYDYNLKEGEITYFLDKSGQRENYYHISNSFVTMDIAAKSGYIVRGTFSSLYSLDPELDLRHIDYEHMGGAEYEAYMKNLIEQTFGADSYDLIMVNAVADDHYCTMDADMKDGCTYEFGFCDGYLTYVEHYLYGLQGRPGWAADSLFVNTITGEQFYEEW